MQHALWGRTVFPSPVFLSRVVTGNPPLHQRLDRQAAMCVLEEVHVQAAWKLCAFPALTNLTPVNHHA